MNLSTFLRKTIYAFVLLPFYGSSQCIQIIDQDADNIEPVIKLVEEYMGLKMEKIINTPFEKYITYKHAKGYCAFIAKVKPHHHINGDSIVTSYTIASVRIYGPGDRIDSLFSYLKIQGKNCADYETGQQYVIYNNQWFKFSNHHPEKEDFVLPLKEIFIDKLVL